MKAARCVLLDHANRRGERKPNRLCTTGEFGSECSGAYLDGVDVEPAPGPGVSESILQEPGGVEVPEHKPVVHPREEFAAVATLGLHPVGQAVLSDILAEIPVGYGVDLHRVDGRSGAGESEREVPYPGEEVGNALTRPDEAGEPALLLAVSLGEHDLCRIEPVAQP